MLNAIEISQNYNSLKALNDNRRAKYHRNYRRYCYTPFASLDNIRNPSVVGYYEQNIEIEDDTTPTPQLNVIKSCIDTLTSKIAQSKVRPFFNTQNGSFKDIQIVKQAQAFFDLFYDAQNVNKKVSEAFRDSCIFDTGVIYINEKTKEVLKALPFQVYVRPAERNYGKITRVYYEQKDYPVTLLPDYLEYETNADYVHYGLYYDTYNKTKAYICDDHVVLIEPYNAEVIPFIFLHYCSPIISNTSQSIVDMLNSIQLEIDNLMMKIKDASQLNPANTYFLPQDSNVKATQLNNRVGNVITYKATPNMTGSPVTVATPAFIDGQYMALIEELKQSAYELVGISQLSAMSTKPTGLNSGVALSTMENIESDRFETQLNQVIRCYVDIAKTCLAIFPKEETILPESNNRINVKWADIVEEANKMVVQFSAADSLSKDPSTKLEQLQQLAMAGIIPPSRIAQFMELPDIQSGYALANNAVNAVLSVINDCIEKDIYKVPSFIPFEMLQEEIINTQLSLKAAASSENDNMKDIEKLDRLLEDVEKQKAQWMATMPMQQGQTTENGMPMQTNVLTQEANMQQVPPEMNTPDMDVNTPQGNAINGQWNAPYQQ
ncbi:MAG: hypothetical protein MJ174_07430 [Treponema sp.]|nr:hypothetical protein [Treponema sp.]